MKAKTTMGWGVIVRRERRTRKTLPLPTPGSEELQDGLTQWHRNNPSANWSHSQTTEWEKCLDYSNSSQHSRSKPAWLCHWNCSSRTGQWPSPYRTSSRGKSELKVKSSRHFCMMGLANTFLPSQHALGSMQRVRGWFVKLVRFSVQMRHLPSTGSRELWPSKEAFQ